jgi:hypothetical protein
MEKQPYTQSYTDYVAPPARKLPIGRLIIITIIILAIIVAIEVISALSIRGKTGLLEVSAPAGTSISISAPGQAAASIGTTAAKLRIDPGTYLLVGTQNGAHGALVATVSQGQTTDVSLQPSSISSIRSEQDINFKGVSGLINAGLTVSQVNEIEQDIFNYKTTANTVTIDQNSIEPGPHNPNTDIGFTLDFTVSIDSTTYAAVATYTDTEDTSLQLSNPTNGQVVYNSDSTTQQTGGD